MKLTRDRVRSFGWVAVLTVCGALTMGLTLRVNAVKSQVRLAERQIVALRQQKTMLETEFETRANQQQLKVLNDVEFGYQAPTAGQYLEGERQLASLSKPRGPDAPTPIRVASAVDAEPAVLATILSSVSGATRDLQSAHAAPAVTAHAAGAHRSGSGGRDAADRLAGLDRLEAGHE
jgi:hypothetical protein